MKTKLGLLLAVMVGTLPVIAQTDAQNHAVLIRQVARGTNGLLPLTRAQWKDVTTARKASPGNELHSYAEARTNATVNAQYFSLLLVMIETEIDPAFRKVHGRPPFAQEVFACWLVGIPKFKSLRYDFSKITDPVLTKQLQALSYEIRLATLARARMAEPVTPPVPKREGFSAPIPPPANQP